MTESRKVTQSIAETYQYTAEDTAANASDCLSRAIRSLQEISDFDDSAAQLYSQLLDADSLLNDFNRELSNMQRVLNSLKKNSARPRKGLNLINHLKAKYGKTVTDILTYCDEKKRRIEELNDYDFFYKRSGR